MIESRFLRKRARVTLLGSGMRTRLAGCCQQVWQDESAGSKACSGATSFKYKLIHWYGWSSAPLQVRCNLWFFAVNVALNNLLTDGSNGSGMGNEVCFIAVFTWRRCRVKKYQRLRSIKETLKLTILSYWREANFLWLKLVCSINNSSAIQMGAYVEAR